MKRLFVYLSIIVSMLMVSVGAQAEDVYLRSNIDASEANSWYTWDNNIAEYQFSREGSTDNYTYTFELTTDLDIQFRIAVAGWDNQMKAYATTPYSLTIGGDSYGISDDCYGSNNYWTLTASASSYSSVTIHVLLTYGSRKVWITGVERPVPTISITDEDSESTNGSMTRSGIDGGYYVYTYTLSSGSYSAGAITLGFSYNETEYTATEDAGDLTVGVASNVNNGEGSIIYTIPDNATGDITITFKAPVAGEDSPTVTVSHATAAPVDPSAGGEGYYLVGNFFNTDGNTASDINYDNRYFKMKYAGVEDGYKTYTFDMPATLTVYAQILRSNGSADTYWGPTTNQSTGPADNSSTAKISLSQAATKTNNYWNFQDRGMNSDGMYTHTLYVDASTGNPVSWKVTHVQLTRVAFYWPKGESTTAQPTYSTRANTSSSGDNKYFGNVYLAAGQECFVFSNIKDEADNDTYNGLLKTVNKLYKQGNGGGYIDDDGATQPAHPSGYDDWHKVYPGCTTGFKYVSAGALTLEYNPSAGQSEKEAYAANNGIGGEVKKSSGSNQKEITSISIIGNGISTVGSWNLEDAKAMTYNPDLRCYEYTFTSTLDESSSNKFRFIANGSWALNWREDGTTDAAKARIPYESAGTGHAATEDDPNDVVEAPDKHSETDYDIIFNRPAGEWTIRFYIETLSNGNDAKYHYYYTITENPDVALAPGTLDGTYVFSGYAANEEENLTVTLAHADKYQYAWGEDVDLDGEGVTDSDAGTIILRYTGTDVEMKDDAGNWSVVADGTNRVSITIRGVDSVNNKNGVSRVYTYEFDATPLTVTISLPGGAMSGGFYINKKLIEGVEVKVNGSVNTTIPLYWKVSGSASPSEGPTAEDNLVKNGDDNRSFYLSTPGYLVVGDGNGNYVTSNGKFDFTYSTSENYLNYYHNGSTTQQTLVAGGADGVTIFVKADSYENISLYVWDYTYDQIIQQYQNGGTTDYDSELSSLGLEKHSGTWNDAGTETMSGGIKFSETGAGFAKRDPFVTLTSLYPGNYMTDERSIMIAGEKYYYFTFKTSQLHAKGDEVGVIVNQYSPDADTGDLTASKYADKTKTPDFKFIGNSVFTYISNGENTEGKTDKNRIELRNNIPNEDLAEIMKVMADNMVFFNAEGWTAPIYCYAYDDDKNAEATWPGKEMQKVPNTSSMYYHQTDGTRTRLIFTDSNGHRSQTDLKDGHPYESRGYYTQDDQDAKGNGTHTKGVVMTAAQYADYKAFMDITPHYVTETTMELPNGADYYRIMPSDKTVLLDPTWGGKIDDPLHNTDNEENSIAHWSGYPASEAESGEKIAGYRKRVTDATLTQTVRGLDASKTYTVQAIVRAEGENGVKLALALNSATSGSGYDCRIARDGSGNNRTATVDGHTVNISGTVINKYGRVEYLTPEATTTYDNGKTINNNEWMRKQGGVGWFKLEASARPSNAGNLVIALQRENGDYFDLADVTLLEDANNEDGYGYRTTATKFREGNERDKMMNMDTYADYTDRYSPADPTGQRNNAFSFFDRGENRNAIIYADNHTVIAMGAGMLAGDNGGSISAAHRHPYNVVMIDNDHQDDVDIYCDVLYLTDMGLEDAKAEYYGESKLMEDYYNYYRAGYTFAPYGEFIATHVVLDRKLEGLSATLMLPFDISVKQLKEIYNCEKVCKFSSYDDKNRAVHFENLSDEDDINANTPVLLRGVSISGTLDSRVLDEDEWDGAAIKSGVTRYFTTSDGETHTSSEYSGETTLTSEEGTVYEPWEGFTGVYRYTKIAREATITGYEYNEETEDYEYVSKGVTHFGYNALNGGSFDIVNPSGANYKPFRAYLTVPRSWAELYGTHGNLAKSFRAIFDDETVTSVTSVESRGGADGNVYSVNGVLVGKDGDLRGLRKGVYIVNGQKYVVK